ncbi:DoxX family protein [Emticicia sp. C21]|uniref:DoxX family protein n=1 Tax=Emticicia sp. C21 TaxID=2302915 RepID=UPI000E34767E|nr:DoxX family protein [Emticicia sp. C21]RFS15534.1 DoxX family protein [Emticicia sp. C21]
MKTLKTASWVLRIIAAVILLQTLYFKFTAHPESVELFTKLGAEPWGRIGTGILELITGILLLIPATAFIGGFLAMGLMFGAIASHILVIGIESKSDGGQLFMLAIIVLICSMAIQIIHHKEGRAIAEKYLPASINQFFKAIT